MNTGFRGRSFIGALLAGHVAVAAGVTQARAPALVALDIKQQSLGDALNEFAQQSGVQIVLYTEVGAGISSPMLLGRFTTANALERRASIRYAESAERGISIIDYRPELGADYVELAGEVLERLGFDEERRRVDALARELAPA